jgi:hypothetical protein
MQDEAEWSGGQEELVFDIDSESGDAERLSLPYNPIISPAINRPCCSDDLEKLGLREFDGNLCGMMDYF